MVEFWRVQTADNGQRGGGETHSMAFHSGLIASLVHTPIKLCFFVFFLRFTFERTFQTAACQSPDYFLIRVKQEQLVLSCQQTICVKRKTILCKADEERRSSSCGWVRDRWTADCQASVNIWYAWTQLCRNFGTRLLNFTVILVHLHSTQVLFAVNCVVKQFYPWQQSAVYFSVSCVLLLT